MKHPRLILGITQLLIWMSFPCLACKACPDTCTHCTAFRCKCVTAGASVGRSVCGKYRSSDTLRREYPQGI